jgi:hypothetical protein
MFEATLSALLTERYGDTFTRATVSYVKCPGAGFSYDRHYGRMQTCRYEFGSRWARDAGFLTFADVELGVGETMPPTGLTPERPFAVRPVTCRRSHVGAAFAEPDWRVTALRATKGGADACRNAGRVVARLASTGSRLDPEALPRDVRSDYAAKGYDALDLWTCGTTGVRARRVVCVNGLDHRIVATLRPRRPAAT